MNNQKTNIFSFFKTSGVKKATTGIVASPPPPPKNKSPVKREVPEHVEEKQELLQEKTNTMVVEKYVHFDAVPATADEASVQVKKKKRSLVVSDDEDEDGNAKTKDMRPSVEPESPVDADPMALLKSIITKRPMSRKEIAEEKSEEKRFHFLTDLKDENKRGRDHPDYDPRTLFIDDKEYKKLTAFEQQYWDIKKKNFDTVVFFKKGKFYELYEDDADIGHNELGLKVTDRVNMRMSGVPENAFAYWASKLVAKGYKVARVTQTETPHTHVKDKGKSSKDGGNLLKRELQEIITSGSVIDADLMTGEDQSIYIMSIVGGPNQSFGLCFVDAARGEIISGYISDNSSLVELETVLTRFRPAEIIYKSKSVDSKVISFIKNVLSAKPPVVTARHASREYWLTDRVLLEFQQILGMTPKVLETIESNELAMAALSGAMVYLKELKLTEVVVQQANIVLLDYLSPKYLIMDGKCIQNLELFSNSFDGGADGALYTTLDKCVTPGGKRKLRNWLLSPLYRSAAINARLDIVSELSTRNELREMCRKAINKMGDLERHVTRSGGGRAKVTAFIEFIGALERLHNSWVTLSKQKIDNPTLQRLLSFGIELEWSGLSAVGDSEVPVPDVGTDSIDQYVLGLTAAGSAWMPDMHNVIAGVKSMYEKTSSFGTGSTSGDDSVLLVPVQGVDSDCDDWSSRIVTIESMLQNELESVKLRLKIRDISFKNLNKDLFLLEIPSSYDIPSEYTLVSKTKDVHRYRTSVIADLVYKYQEALEKRNEARANFFKRVCAKFNKYKKYWLWMSDIVSTVDVLQSLATVSQGWTRPTVLSEDTAVPVFDMVEGKHPVLCSRTNYIPNSLVIGDTSPYTVLITGPNMGGKSTLLRQCCLLAILAQVGCFVPANSLTMTPCDRMFARLGASDSMNTGQSTFMVELLETSRMLKFSTEKSMVILDELGRGTSTFDGLAVADAVLAWLIEKRCRALFSTHYHMLAGHAGAAPYHMSYLIDDKDPQCNRVVFLYKLKEGVAASYGINVAQMAGLPGRVVTRAAGLSDLINKALNGQLKQ